ncbi:MAG TPA: TonB-dependent receptor [Thermoanaerobaculia bacterium]|nr:TonB-dependent receptor [Thermoanaerobaculia bacterium]
MISTLLLLLLIDDPATAPPPPQVDMVITVERQTQEKGDAAAAVSVLKREELRALPVESLSEALAVVPGITMMFDSGASGAPMITSRGFFGGGEVEYVKLLVDGVPVGDAESGLADWSRFRLEDVERIEIVHGPGSAAWGDTALGGVIQLFTRRAPRSGFAHATVGGFGTRSAEAGYREEVAPGVYLGGSADVASTDGSREHSSRRDGGIRLTLDASPFRVTADVARKDRREPGPLTYAEIAADREQSNALFRFDRERTNRERLAASYDSNWLHLGAYGSRRGSDNLRTLLLAPAFGITALRELDSRELGVSGTVTRGFLHAGVDASRTSFRGDYFGVEEGVKQGRVAAADGHRNLGGVFLTGTWSVCSRCQLTAGARRDEIRDRFSNGSRSASATSPRAAFTYRAGPASYWLQLSRAFKAPTLDQLFDPRPYPDFAGGTIIVSNPALRPQRARNIEAGMSGERAGARWSLVAYRMNVTDEIDFDPQTFTYRNISSSLHRGVEASFAMNNATVTYAWTHVGDPQLKNIPEHVVQGIYQAHLPRGLVADVIYRWMHGRWLDDEHLFAEGNVSRVDLRLARDFGPARISLDVLNATNAKYNEVGFVLADFAGNPNALAFPAPGRAARVGVTWRF